MHSQAADQRVFIARLELLAKWLDGEPEVPGGPWYKRFSGMTVYGEGELTRTLPAHAPRGKRVI